jgi:hypothetical protein
MASVEFDLLGAFETHSVDEIRAILDDGLQVASDQGQVDRPTI